MARAPKEPDVQFERKAADFIETVKRMSPEDRIRLYKLLQPTGNF